MVTRSALAALSEDQRLRILALNSALESLVKQQGNF
jgi:hypothetical protein